MQTGKYSIEQKDGSAESVRERWRDAIPGILLKTWEPGRKTSLEW